MMRNMTIQEISIGRERAVVVPMSTWERIVEQLEELEDIKAFDKGRGDKGSTVGHAELCRRLGRSPLRYLRIRAGITQTELARKAGLSQSFLAKVEASKKRLSIASRKKVAMILGVSAEKLEY